MLASPNRRFFLVCLTVQISFTFAASIQNKISSLSASSDSWSDLCIPFSEEAVTSANLTEAEKSVLPDICYQPGLAPHLFGTQDNRGIPPGVDCTPVEWYGCCLPVPQPQQRLTLQLY